MPFEKSWTVAVILLLTVLASGCAIAPQPYNYAAFRDADPRTLLILPPLNSSPEVEATYGMLSQMSHPLAESGYYVLPVALVDETFKQNGLHTAHDIHHVEPGKLREIFDADAALYVDVKDYGSRYMVISSATIVTAEARLVDLNNGKTLWHGAASASSEEGQNNSGGLVGMLVSAVINQIINSTTDASYRIAGLTSQRLLMARPPNGMLHGPRSPRYGKD